MTYVYIAWTDGKEDIIAVCKSQEHAYETITIYCGLHGLGRDEKEHLFKLVSCHQVYKGNRPPRQHERQIPSMEILSLKQKDRWFRKID